MSTRKSLGALLLWHERRGSAPEPCSGHLNGPTCLRRWCICGGFDYAVSTLNSPLAFRTRSRSRWLRAAGDSCTLAGLPVNIVSYSVKLRRKLCAPPVSGLPHAAFLMTVRTAKTVPTGVGANRTAPGRSTDIKTHFVLLHLSG